MGRTEKSCSICSKPGAREVIDAMLAKRVPMKEIARLTGCTKSSIGRHSLKCVIRSAAQKLMHKRFDPRSQRVLTALNDGRYFIQHDPLNERTDGHFTSDADLRSDDVVIRVSYEQVVIRNPRALPAKGQTGLEANTTIALGDPADL